MRVREELNLLRISTWKRERAENRNEGNDIYARKKKEGTMQKDLWMQMHGEKREGKREKRREKERE